MNVGSSVQAITTLNDAVYVSSIGTGILRSDNDGGSWVPMNNGLPNTTGVRTITASGNVLLVGHNMGIHRSVDEGANWTLSNSGIPATTQSAREFFHFNGVDLAVFSGTIADGGGIYRSENTGLNWSMGHSGMSTNMAIHDITMMDDALFAATSVGIFRSDDLALSWQSVPNANYTTYAVEAVDDRLIMITSFGALYSDNSGYSWSQPANGMNNNPARAEIAYFQGAIYAIAGSQFASQVYRSFDLGANYSLFLDGLAPIDQQNQNTFHRTIDRLYMGALMDAYWTDESTVEIQLNEERGDLMIFPTIADEGFHLMLNEAISGSVLMLDISGREVSHIRITDQKQWINTSGLSNGRYDLMIIDKECHRIASDKIIVSR
jgi:hypothetical protein